MAFRRPVSLVNDRIRDRMQRRVDLHRGAVGGLRWCLRGRLTVSKEDVDGVVDRRHVVHSASLDSIKGVLPPFFRQN